jgi:hypothetical protein
VATCAFRGTKTLRGDRENPHTIVVAPNELPFQADTEASTAGLCPSCAHDKPPADHPRPSIRTPSGLSKSYCREAGGRPRHGGLAHSLDSRRFHRPSWYHETSTIAPLAGRTASQRGQRNLYRLTLAGEVGFHRTRRAVPQTHFTSVRPISCRRRPDYTCPLGQVSEPIHPERGGRLKWADALAGQWFATSDPLLPALPWCFVGAVSEVSA